MLLFLIKHTHKIYINIKFSLELNTHIQKYDHHLLS